MAWKFELLMKPDTEQFITEGPVWDGERIYITQIRKNRILRYDPKTGVIDEWRTGTNRTNGLAFDAQGRLFGCCSGGRAIVRFDADGKNVVIADRIDGKKLNTPNDLAIDRKGRIWFTNPIKDDGSLGGYDALFTWGEDARGVHRGIDGMCLDAEGNIVATAGYYASGSGPMIYVFSPTGRVLETHPLPANRPTNCCFGGADLTTLFVTSTNGHFFKAQTGRVGWAMYP